jgi:hypothetical protein
LSEEQKPQIEMPGERDEPKFDFGAGELAEKVAMLKEKLGITPKPDGIVDPDAPATLGEPDSGDAADGIDWSRFDLDPSLAHLYPQAQVLDTPQGPKWAVQLDEFLTREKNANPSKANDGTPRRTANGEAADMTAFVNDMLREPPDQGATQWRLVAFMPGSMTGMMQVIFQRKIQVALPDPMMTEAEEDKVVAPTDEELTRIEQSAAEWAGEAAPAEPYVTNAD